MATGWSFKAEILSESSPGIFAAEEASILEFGNNLIHEFVKTSWKHGRLDKISVNSVVLKPGFHLVHDGGRLAFDRTLSAARGKTIVHLSYRRLALQQVSDSGVLAV